MIKMKSFDEAPGMYVRSGELRGSHGAQVRGERGEEGGSES